MLGGARIVCSWTWLPAALGQPAPNGAAWRPLGVGAAKPLGASGLLLRFDRKLAAKDKRGSIRIEEVVVRPSGSFVRPLEHAEAVALKSKANEGGVPRVREPRLLVGRLETFDRE
jgi:hypothetical protein